MFCISLFLAGCGSQSEAAVYRCLWLRTIFRQLFPTWFFVGSCNFCLVFVSPCRTVSGFPSAIFVFSVQFLIMKMNTYPTAFWSDDSSSSDESRYECDELCLMYSSPDDLPLWAWAVLVFIYCEENLPGHTHATTMHSWILSTHTKCVSLKCRVKALWYHVSYFITSLVMSGSRPGFQFKPTWPRLRFIMDPFWTGWNNNSLCVTVGDAGLCSKTKQLQVSSSSSQLGEEEKQLLAEDCSLSHKSALKCLMNCELWRGVLPLGDTPGSLLTQTLVIGLSCVSSTPRFPGIFLLTCYWMYPEYFQISWSTNGVKSTENVKRAWNQPCDV